jgi:hypothetical protein
MKILRKFLLAVALIGSLAMPLFFLAVAHFHLEKETAERLVSMWPRSEIALEDKRAMADMLITYGELGAMSTLTYSAIAWCGLFVYSLLFRRTAGEKALDG